MSSWFKHTPWLIDIDFFPQPKFQHLFMHVKEFSKNDSMAMGQIELMACCGRLLWRVEVWLGRRADNNWLEVANHFVVTHYLATPRPLKIHILKIFGLCHRFYLLCSILIVNYDIVSPTLNVNPTLFAIPCNYFGGSQIYNVARTVIHQVNFHSNFNHPWQYFITRWWQKKVGCWPMDELIHHPWQ